MTLADVFSNPLKYFNPLGYTIEKGLGDLFTKTAAVIGSNISSGQSPLKSLADVYNAPASPVIINQPAKTGLDALGIGFIEKNVIIIGLLALGGLAIYRTIK